MSSSFTSLPHVCISEDRDARYLHLGDTPWIQGAMNRRKPYALQLQYIQRMMAWLLWADLDEVFKMPIVQLGLGSASLSKYTSIILECPTTVIEINEHVIYACHRWFHFPEEHENLLILNEDALAWLKVDAPIGEAYCVQVDMYDEEASSPVLDTIELYKNIKKVLSPDGMLVINLFGKNVHFKESLKRIEIVFGKEAVWRFKPTKEGNVVVLAHNNGKSNMLSSEKFNNKLDKIKKIDTTNSLKSHNWQKSLIAP